MADVVTKALKSIVKQLRPTDEEELNYILKDNFKGESCWHKGYKKFKAILSCRNSLVTS